MSYPEELKRIKRKLERCRRHLIEKLESMGECSQINSAIEEGEERGASSQGADPWDESEEHRVQVPMEYWLASREVKRIYRLSYVIGAARYELTRRPAEPVVAPAAPIPPAPKYSIGPPKPVFR